MANQSLSHSAKGKVLVTGGAGFIGSHTADALLAQGYEVVAADNMSTGSPENMNPASVFYHADITQSGLEILFREHDISAVIHEAGQINVRSSAEKPLEDASTNILGTLNLLQLCVSYGVSRFVFASSGGTVYGSPEALPASESSPLNPLSPYGISKASVENYLRFYESQHGIICIALRYANVYGPRQNPKGEAGVIAAFIKQILNGERPCIWGSGEQTRDFVYVDDVVKANLASLSYSGRCRTFNIGTGKESSINDVYSAISSVLGFIKPEHNDSYDELVPRICLDSSLALRELGWTAKTSLQEGIKKTISWPAPS